MNNSLLAAICISVLSIISCKKISQIEKKVNGGSFVITIDPSDSGDFKIESTQKNNFKSELEKAGISLNKIKSIKAVIDSIIIINNDLPELNFSHFSNIKLDVVAIGFDRRVLSKIDKFENGSIKYIPEAIKTENISDLVKSGSDLTFNLSGHKKLKTPLKKDMKYCVSFYVSLSEDNK